MQVLKTGARAGLSKWCFEYIIHKRIEYAIWNIFPPHCGLILACQQVGAVFNATKHKHSSKIQIVCCDGMILDETKMLS
jgi:hypothetical protein